MIHQPELVVEWNKQHVKNFVQLFSDAITGMIFLYLYAISQLENYLKKHFTSFILLSIENSNLIYFFTMRLLFPF